MNINLTTRMKAAILFSGLFLSILTIAIISDAFGIRSYSPYKKTGGYSGGSLIIPPKPKKLPGTKPLNGSYSDDESEGSGRMKPPSKSPPGSGKKPSPSPSPPSSGPSSNPSILQEVPVLFKADLPDKLKLDDSKLLESDFFDALKNIPIRSSGFVGVANKTNSCYADSTLQMLYRIPVVRKVVANFEIYLKSAKNRIKDMDSKIESYEADETQKVLLGQFQTKRADLMKAVQVIGGLNHMFYQLHNNDKSAAVFSFAKSMQCMPGKFSGTNQEDADEYFTLITSCINDLVPPSQLEHVAFQMTLRQVLADPKGIHATEIRAPEITNETKIPVALMGHDDCNDLECLLDKVFADEILTGIDFNDGIGQGNLQRTKRFSRMPEILPIQLIRLVKDPYSATYADIKISREVDIPHILNLKKYCESSVPDVDTEYQLKMFVEHIGTRNGGHYVAYSYEHSDKNWYLLNDSHVSVVNPASPTIDKKVKVAIVSDVFGVRTYKATTTGTLVQTGGHAIANNGIKSYVDLLFKAGLPADFPFNSAKFFEADFISQLNEPPMPKSNKVGIVSRGNSCYADSVIQMLFRIPVVRKIVANLNVYQRRAEIIMLNKNELITAELAEAILVLEGLNHMFYQLQTNDATKPADFTYKKAMQSLPGRFYENKQEDADEYFTKIMGSLKDILPESQHHHLLLEVSFNGTLRGKADPTRTEPKTKKDVEMRISLLLNKSSKDINTLLDEYFAPETAELAFEDDNKTPGILTRAKRLTNLPKIITIHLQRLTADYSRSEPTIVKNYNTISMCDDINFAKYIDIPGNTTSTIYRLKMFAVHFGGVKSGHYFAYTRNNNLKNSWYKLNDDVVTLDADPVKFLEDKNSGYLYFYERID